jgi:hypothetical protein
LQELGIEHLAGKALIQVSRIDTDNDRFEPQFNERPGQLGRVLLPNREYPSHSELPKILLSVLSEVLEKDVPKGHRNHTLTAVPFQDRLHPGFVFSVGRVLGNINLLERQADGFCLALQQLPAHPVHADPVVAFRDRTQQGGN